MLLILIVKCSSIFLSLSWMRLMNISKNRCYDACFLQMIYSSIRRIEMEINGKLELWRHSLEAQVTLLGIIILF